MKKVLLLSTFVCSAFVAFSAMAQDSQTIRQYGAARINYNMFDYDYKEDGFNQSLDDSVLGGSLAYGLKIKNFRAELEGFYNQSGKDNFSIYGVKVPVEVETKGVFLNGYYDIPTETFITPYVSAGIGYVKAKGKIKFMGYSASEDDSNTAWNIGAGASIAVNDNINLDLGYRYTDYGSFDMGDGAKFDMDSHTITMGVRYTF